MRKVPNLLLHDNVLSIVIEFDTRRVLDPDKGSLFGVIAETVPLRARCYRPLSHRRVSIGSAARNRPTFASTIGDWRDADDLRDLWNQQTPFAIADELQPVFLKRLKDSLAN